MRAAAEKGECWVLTRKNNVHSLHAAFADDPSAHAVHFVGVDAPEVVLSLKRRLGAIRLYYSLWQRLARRQALRLDRTVDFDVLHHATWSAFWLPVGVMGISKPLVVGPTAGGELTPRRLLSFLGAKGVMFDALRWFISRSAGLWKGRSWRQHISVLLAQNQQMGDFAKRRLVGSEVPIIVHPHASNPTVEACIETVSRSPEFLFVGRLLRWKGLFLALEAFAQADVDQARLVFIGDGEAKGALQARIAKMGLQDRVSLAGSLPRDEVLQRLCSASALLFPSFHDSAGFVVSEALSLGVPVICLDHGGPGALASLWPDVPHRAIKVGSANQVVQELSAAIREMLSNPAPLVHERVSPAVNLSDVVSNAYDLAVKRGKSA